MKNVRILNAGKVCCNGSPQTVRGKGLAGTDISVRTEGGGGRCRKINASGLQ